MHTEVILQGGPFDGASLQLQPWKLADALTLSRAERYEGQWHIACHKYRVESVSLAADGNLDHLVAQYHGMQAGEPLTVKE